MSEQLRFFAAAVVAIMTFATTICADRTRPVVRVLLRNDASVPATTVDAAHEAVRPVSHTAGVHIVWSGRPPVATLALIARDEARKLHPRPEVLGFATGRRGRAGKIAYIFVHRVNDLAARYRLDPSVILGAVMAHELGHLLLPFESHSQAGLMRPLLDAADFRQAHRGELLFTAEQAAQIRSATEAHERF